MSWQNQEEVYLIMWKSHRSGATLSDLRKTDEGKNRLVDTLIGLGYDPEEIIVVKQEKAWKPTKLGGFKKERAN